MASDSFPDTLADRIISAGDSSRQIEPLTDADPRFDFTQAYAVAARVAELRAARGERPVGWKIGFTNRTIWAEYGVYAPIWGPMYSTTFAEVGSAGPVEVPLAGLAEPRLEPEIAFRLSATPRPDMDATALLGCIDAAAHGVELVQSLYPGWRFKAADTVAAFALHGRYSCGPLVPIVPAERERWLRELAAFEITLSRDSEEIDRGHASNVLSGPLLALQRFVQGMAAHPFPPGLRPGDIVTTGTVTRAFPVAVGETWRTEIHGLPLPGLELRFV